MDIDNLKFLLFKCYLLNGNFTIYFMAHEFFTSESKFKVNGYFINVR